MLRLFVWLWTATWVMAQTPIVFTGNTQSYLEPCGCVKGMLGGIARRPQAFPKGAHILVDSGNFTEIRDELDRLRNEFYAQSFAKMGYQVVGLGSSEATQPASWLMSLPGKELYVSGNLKPKEKQDFFPASKKLGEYVFTSLLPAEELHADFTVEDPADFLKSLKAEGKLVLFSSLPPEELASVVAKYKDRIALVIANRARGDFARLAGVPVAYPGDKGKIVRTYDFAARKLKSQPVEEGFEANQELEKVVSDYFQAVAQSPDLQKVVRRHYENDPLEKEVLAGTNKFIGSESCKACHSEQFEQYETTRHAHAFDTLLQKKRDHVPDCVQCHSIGFGYDSGYEIVSRQKHLQDVGCESCHGPGLEHFRNPKKDNIYREVSEARCQACHDAENSPNFNYQAYLPMVNHSIKAHTKEQPKPVKLDKPDVDLYVMSQCPFGVRAENAMIPLVKKFGEQLDFKLHFIATANEAALKEAEEKRKSGEAPEAPEAKKLPAEAQAPAPGTPGCQANFEIDPNAKFQSLHGQPEVDENIRQLLVEHFYPDKFLDFLLDRNQNIYGDFDALVKKHGMDPKKIEEGMTSGLGDQLLVDNILPSNQLGIQASPTLRINEQAYSLPFETVPLEYEICQRFENPPAWCAKAPPCATDSHCRMPGKDGKCIAAGTPQARCDFTEPMEVKMTVIRDESCSVCETGPFLRQLYELYENLDVSTLSSSDPKAREWLKKLGSDRLPLYVFEGSEFLQSPRTQNLQRYLAYRDGTYFINPLITEVSSLQRPMKPGGLTFYYTALSPALSLAAPVLNAVNQARQKGMEIDFKMVPIVAQSRNQAAAGGGSDQRFMVQVQTPNGVQSLYLESQNGRNEIIEGMHQGCVMSEATQGQTVAYMQSMANQVVAATSGMPPQNIAEWAQSAPLAEMRKKAYSEAMIGSELQKKIEACSRNPDLGPRSLVEGFVDVLNTRIMASPTLLINDHILVRGATDKLVEMLPRLWSEGMEGSE